MSGKPWPAALIKKSTSTLLSSSASHATRDLEVLGNQPDGQYFIGLEGSLICKDSDLKLLFLCLGSLLFEESLSLSMGHCGEGDLVNSWWASGGNNFVSGALHNA